MENMCQISVRYFFYFLMFLTITVSTSNINNQTKSRQPSLNNSRQQSLNVTRQASDHNNCPDQNNHGKNGSEYKLAEKSALELLRPLVNNILLEKYMCEDTYLIKYLRTKNLVVKQAADMIKAEMEWRKENRISGITQEDFSKFKKRFTVFLQGYDKEGRPVFTTALRLLNGNVEIEEVEQFKRYLMRNLEATAERIRAVGKKNITQSIVIFDMDGIDSQRHLCFRCLNLLAYFVRIYENYYPQQSFLTYGINVPATTAEAVNAIRPVMSEHTKRTIRAFGTNKEEWTKELLKQIPKDQLFKRYGVTKFLRQGTNRDQISL